jgi:hypothetical protein
MDGILRRSDALCAGGAGDARSRKAEGIAMTITETILAVMAVVMVLVVVRTLRATRRR